MPLQILEPIVTTLYICTHAHVPHACACVCACVCVCVCVCVCEREREREREREETCNANSSRTLQKNFVPITIDCLATVGSTSFKSANKTGINTEECSIAFNPISSIALPTTLNKIKTLIKRAIRQAHQHL